MIAHSENNSTKENYLKISLLFLRLILSSVQESGINRLFFLTRDGTIFKDILLNLAGYDKNVASKLETVEIGELALSREMTMTLGLPNPDSPLWLPSLISRFKSTCDNSTGLLDFLHYFECIPDSTTSNILNLDFEQIDSWAANINAFLPEVRTQISEVVKRRSDILIRYLKQKKVIGYGEVALVDVGYRGTIAKRILQHLNQEKSLTKLGNQTEFQQFLLLRKQHQNTQISKQKYLITDQDLPAILRLNYSWLEALYRDRSRGILKYYKEEDSGLIHPVFAKSHQTNSLKDIYSKALQRNVDELIQFFNEPATNQDLFLAQFISNMATPNSSTVSYINQFAYENDRFSNHNHQLIKYLSLSDLTYYKIKKLIANDYWLSGCLTYSNKGYLIRFLNCCLKLHDLLKSQPKN